MLTVSALGHPGNTDANGGHYNRSTGEYHYHHGYPEHQHPGGVCPYNFDDKTGQNSGTSGTTRSVENASRANSSSSSSLESSGNTALGLLIIVVFSYLFAAVVKKIAYKSPQKKGKKETVINDNHGTTTEGQEKEQTVHISTVTENNICPRCGKRLVLRNGRYGPFYGCSGYPYCKYTRSIK